MAIKLLENAGIENTGIGASALNNLMTGNKSGIVGKYLNECAFTATGNTIIIDKGLLIICGRQVELDAIESVTLSSLPSEDVRYQIVIELTREEAGEVTASIFVRQPSTLIQENLLKDGFVYQFELGRVTHKTTGQVTEVLRTADILTAGGGGGADFEIGDVTTEMLADGIPAEVDIEKRTEDDKTFLDFTFAIPKGDTINGGDIKDTVTTFTEASTRANIETGEKTSTIFGKIKKWFTDVITSTGTQAVAGDKTFNGKLTVSNSDQEIVVQHTSDIYTIPPSGLQVYGFECQDKNGHLAGGFKMYHHTDGAMNTAMVVRSPYNGASKVIGFRADVNGTYRFCSIDSYKDIDLGSSSFPFKDLYLNGNATVATPTADEHAATKAYADSVGFARVYREATEISGITYPVAIGVLLKTMKDKNLLNTMLVVGLAASTETKVTGLPTLGGAPQTFGMLVVQVPGTDAQRMRVEYSREVGTGNVIKWIGGINRVDPNNWTVDWKMVIDDSTAQIITGVKTYTASPLVPTTPSGPSAAVARSYVDGLTTTYSKVIRTQDEFEALIGDEDWLDAESVALVGQFTLSTANNSGIKIPDTVKQIHGFNGAKITITNFVFNETTAKGGLWYDTLPWYETTFPTSSEYSIRDLEVDCTGTGTGTTEGYGFYNCTNLTNCTGTGTGAANGIGFNSCTNLANCTGTGTGTGGYGFSACLNLTNCTGTGTGTTEGYGFYNCTNLTNCTGTGTGTTVGYGFRDCTNLTNCTGTATGTKYGYGFYMCTNLTNCTGTATGTKYGYGFYNIYYASNCLDDDSSTNMWGGTNKNIDIDTCRKTPVDANNTTLNT